MKRVFSILIACSATAALVAFGYWWGAGKSAQVPPSASAKPEAAGKPRVLYYRNPMGLADTSPTPKKDSMGMDYIPVYEGEEPQGPGVKISLDRVQKLGVRTETASLRVMSHSVRARRDDPGGRARAAHASRPASRAGSSGSTSTPPASTCGGASR